MRVITGRWKGRRLKSPSGQDVRPTTDRVKESIFNILGADIRDCLFLDLCCGAGGLGIEALSRGAAAAVFVDRSRRCLDLVGENLSVCGAEVGLSRLVCAEVTVWLSRWIPSAEPGPWVLVADPPYHSRAAGAIMRELERLASDPGFRAGIVEHGRHTPDLPAGEPDTLEWLTRRYGKSHLAVARARPSDTGEGD